MHEGDEKALVVIRSLVYNHEPYLRDCLEGFVMQQTNFPFVAVVHDDCSTDKSATIIREYAEKYPNIIKPVFESENQYSKHDGSLRRAMDAACEKYGAKYYALCEGDDYWTDPHKLQKQVEFLETHPDYTMVCCDGVVRTPDGDMTEEDFRNWSWKRYHESRDMAVEDIIEQGGWFILTASIVFPKELRDTYPEACRKCPVGDYPLQIFAALNGKVHYFHEKMIVYRFGSINSWSVRERSRTYEASLDFFRREIDMLQSLDEYSGGKYSYAFRRRIVQNVVRLLNSYSQNSEDTLKIFARFLQYEYLRICWPQPERLREKLYRKLMRLCCFPYYPLENYPGIIRPSMKPFISLQRNKTIFHIGRLVVASFVKPADNRVRLYILGLRLF